MPKSTIHIDDRQWGLHTFGRGGELLIALHGFGKDSSVYAPWEQILGLRYTIIAVDLPLHGNMSGRAVGNFQPKDIVRLIERLREEYNRVPYTLVGHSLGARLLMVSCGELPVPPEAIWLLAPDGLATRRLGLLNHLPALLRKWIFRSIEAGYPAWIGLARQLHRLGLIDHFSLRYIRQHLSDADKRRRLLGTWTALSKFPVNKQRWLEASKERPIHLVIGMADPLINWSKLGDWLKKWPASRLHRLEAGHDLIGPEVADLINGSSS